MKKVLYITEKASQVKNLKAALESEKIENFMIEPLSGHITELTAPDKYKNGPKGNWFEITRSNNFPFKPAKTTRKVKGDKKSKDIYKSVKESVGQCDEIVLACDADNEGVVLSMSVLNLLGATKKVRGMIDMTKMDLDSLKKSVHVENKIPYMKMYMAGSARSVIDWFFIQLTIQGTVSFRPIMQDFKNHVVHIGGVKTPTIKLVVDRDREIENHKKTFHWALKAKVKKDSHEFYVNILNKGDAKFSSEEDAKSLKDKLSELKVLKFKDELKTKAPPKPHTLTSLQSEANKKLGIKAKETLSLAQELYDKKFLSYPRTDSFYYGEEDYNNADTYLNIIASFNNDAYRLVIESLKRPLLKRNVFNDEKLKEYSHTALSGTTERPKSFNSTNSRDVYLMVQHRYLMQFMDDYKFSQRDIEGSTNLKDISFRASSKETAESGWKALESKIGGSPEKLEYHSIPILLEGDELELIDVEIEKVESKPKSRYTDATLLEAMENIWRVIEKPEGCSDDDFKELKATKMSLGTVATRASILESLVANGYFKYEKKKLVSTDKAREIAKYLPSDLQSPILRATLEKNLNNIVNNKLCPKSVVDQAFDFVKKSIDQIKQVSQEKMSHIEVKKFTGNIKKLKVKCPLCEAPLLNTKKLYRCESTGSFDGKTKSWDGDCDFTLLKKSKKYGSLTQKDLKTLIDTKSVSVKDKSLILDLDHRPFFIKVSN